MANPMASSNEFIIEDDDAAHVSYLPQDAWQSWNGSNYHANSYHITNVPGAFVTFVFTGSYVAYYSDMNYDHAEFTVILDGETVLNSTSLASRLARQVLLFGTSVPQGTHNLTVRNAGDPGRMGVDYFVYRALLTTPPSSSALTASSLPAPASILDSLSPTTPTQSSLPAASIAPASILVSLSPTAPTQTVSASAAVASYRARTTVGTGAIVGSALAGGALLLLLIGVAVLVARRRRDRDGRALVEARPVHPPAPPSVPPMHSLAAAAHRIKGHPAPASNGPSYPSAVPPPYAESPTLSQSLPQDKVGGVAFHSESE